MNDVADRSVRVMRQREVVQALRAVLPAALRTVPRGGTRPYECDGLAAYRQIAHGRGIAGIRGAGACVHASAMRCRYRSCRAAPVPACPAAPCRSPMASCCRRRPEPHRASLIDQFADRRRSTRRTQSGHSEAAAPHRTVLRTRPVFPDRLHHRRQRRRKLRRRALPEIWIDRA